MFSNYFYKTFFILILWKIRENYAFVLSELVVGSYEQDDYLVPYVIQQKKIWKKFVGEKPLVAMYTTDSLRKLYAPGD